jgi:hypothetical protein
LYPFEEKNLGSINIPLPSRIAFFGACMSCPFVCSRFIFLQHLKHKF